MKRDLLVLVPYPEKDLAQLQAAAGDLRVVTLPETAPEVQLRQALESGPGRHRRTAGGTAAGSAGAGVDSDDLGRSGPLYV